MLTYEKYNNLTQDEKIKKFDGYCQGKTSKYEDKFKSGKLVKPNWLPALYCNIPVPHFINGNLVVQVNNEFI